MGLGFRVGVWGLGFSGGWVADWTGWSETSALVFALNTPKAQDNHPNITLTSKMFFFFFGGGGGGGGGGGVGVLKQLVVSVSVSLGLKG